MQSDGIWTGEFLIIFKKDCVSQKQGWQVSAKGGLNRGLNRFKPVWQKQVSATGFCQCM